MGWLSDDVIASLGGPLRLGVFLHLATDPALRVWLGVSDFKAGMDAIDPVGGAVYLGAGRLIDIPQLDLLINGQGDQIAFGLSGVDADFVARLDAAAPEVRGAKVYVGIAALDERWQPMSSIIPVWRGVADHWSPSRKAATDPEKSPIHTITLTVAVGDTSRAQHKAATFTTSWQSTRTSGDRFFERVPRYIQSYLVVWPRF